MMLTRQGHAVDEVDNGKKALDALLRNEYDLAILDVQMPVMDGLEAAEGLRASGRPVASLPLIALTAQVLDEEVERITASGFDLVLGKPFMEEDLESAIRSVLKQSTKKMLAPAPLPVAVSLHSALAPELVHDKNA
jgi:CheY-like chemotaxis protein